MQKDRFSPSEGTGNGYKAGTMVGGFIKNLLFYFFLCIIVVMYEFWEKIKRESLSSIENLIQNNTYDL